MSTFLCFDIRFLDSCSAFHGSGDGDLAEWPPSPLRLFQALLAAVADKQGQKSELTIIDRQAFEWLQDQIIHAIYAPSHEVGAPVRIAVPNNDLDVWAGPLSKGNEPKKQPNELKAMKAVRVTRIMRSPTRFPAVHYLIPLTDGACPHFETLQAAARGVTHLGWGVDMVVGNADIITSEEAANLPGERWQVTQGTGGVGLRVPRAGTFAALTSRHQAFLHRLSGDGFKPVPPLTTFHITWYRRATDPAPQQWAAFTILKPDASGYRSFDPCRRTRDVAGMVRHAVCELARRQGWSQEDINRFIHGKTSAGDAPSSGETSPDRFSYLPLPTISARQNRVESIRRVLITAPAHCQEKIDWIRRALAGDELINEELQAEGLLTILPLSDWVLRRYTDKAKTWATVTPVILPGHDDNRPAKTDRIVYKALQQAGVTEELLSKCDWEWRRVGYHSGLDLAGQYLPPENLNGRPRYHVKIVFPHEVSGPMAIGSGRFRGFGLFAALGQ